MLGEVLGWKFDHVQGISTKNGVLVAWPESLGERPTDEQISAWTAEYEARPQFHWLTATEAERLEEIRLRLAIPD